MKMGNFSKHKPAGLQIDITLITTMHIYIFYTFKLYIYVGDYDVP